MKRPSQMGCYFQQCHPQEIKISVCALFRFDCVLYKMVINLCKNCHIWEGVYLLHHLGRSEMSYGLFTSTRMKGRDELFDKDPKGGVFESRYW